MRKTGTNRREEEKGTRRHRERKEVCVYIETEVRIDRGGEMR